MRPKRCRCCGKVFTVEAPMFAKQYCSDDCLKTSLKIRLHARHQRNYKPRKPHETVCKKCGRIFLGKWGAGYCINCLTDGSRYMTQLLLNRKV